ncbi:MAG TPA: hypothetical protein DD418_01375 [Pseudomonas sp.]|nr:hypothetical protein [Pseudomonas sp.]
MLCRAVDACVEPLMRVHPGPCRSGFTREYGSSSNGERRVEIGQQARPFSRQVRLLCYQSNRKRLSK